MVQTNKVCPVCSAVGHSKFYCKKKPFTPLKRTAIVKKTVPVKRSPTPEAKAKKKAWDAFSAYIRARDCIRFTGDIDEGMCVTCNKGFPYKKLQAGHFINSRRNAVLFDERIVYSQCYSCNIGGGGAYIEYFVFMEQEWGREKIDEFRALKHQTLPLKLHHFQEIEQKFITKRKELIT